MRRRYASLPTIFLIATFWLKVIGRPLLLFHGIYHMESRHAQMIIVEGFSFLTLQRLWYPHGSSRVPPSVALHKFLSSLLVRNLYYAQLFLHELKSLPSIQSTISRGNLSQKQLLQAIWQSYPLLLAVYYSCMYRGTILGGSKFRFGS